MSEFTPRTTVRFVTEEYAKEPVRKPITVVLGQECDAVEIIVSDGVGSSQHIATLHPDGYLRIETVHPDHAQRLGIRLAQGKNEIEVRGA